MPSCCTAGHHHRVGRMLPPCTLEQRPDPTAPSAPLDLPQTHQTRVAGITNTSGAWVTPAFQLHLSKLDVVEPRPPLEPVTVRRLPPTHPEAAAAPSGGSGDAAPVAAPVLSQAVHLAAQAAAPGKGADEAEEGEAEEVQWAERDGDGGAEDGGSPGGGGASAAAAAPPLPAAAAAAGPGVASQPASAWAPPPPPLSSCWFTHLLLDCDGVMVDTEVGAHACA